MDEPITERGASFMASSIARKTLVPMTTAATVVAVGTAIAFGWKVTSSATAGSVGLLED